MRRSLLSTTAIAALVLAPALALAQANGPSGTIQEQPRKQEPTQGGKTVTPAPGQMAPGKSAQTQTPTAPHQMNNQAQQQAPTGQVQQHQRLQGQAQPELQREHKAPVQQGQLQQPKGTQGEAQEQKGEPNKAVGTQQHQTGAASTKTRTAAQVQVTQQQKTQIHERLAHFKVERIEHPQFSVRVGVEIPRSVHVEVLPPEIVEIVPEYQGFDYVLVGNEILIIDPYSMQIVAVIPA
jgi:hypothetical protein